MAARHALALLAAGIAVAVVTTGCATTVTGTPRAATTPAATTSQSGTPQSTSASITASPSTSATTPEPSSEVRPMPPLDSSGAASSNAQSGTAPGTVAGVDLSAVLAQLDRSHVATVSSTADVAKLTTIVSGARAKGLDLSAVSIGSAISNDNTSTISRELFASTGGTLVVLSPTLVSARSDQLTDAQRDAAIKAAANGKDDVQSLTNFVASALKSVGASTTATSTKTTTTPSPTTHPKVNGVDINAVIKLLGADHIAIPAGFTDVTAKQLQPEVQKAWKADLDIYVAFLAKDPTGHLYDVSSAIMDVTGGTVVVISPKRYAISSETIKNDVLQKALDSAAKADTYPQMVTEVINTLLAS